MNVITKTTQIVQQGLALDQYLKTLLADLPSDDEPVLKQAETVAELLPKLEVVAESVQLPAVHPVIRIQAPALVPIEPKVKEAAPTVKPIRPLSVMPDWSRKEFQALFFKVDQQVLAIPLTELSRTLIFNRTPTKLPSQPGWFIGLMEDQGKKVGILDTGQLIFGKIIGGQRDLVARPFTSILISGDGKWGFACDEILTINKVFPDKVRWRTLRKNRPWLIGTVIEDLTAVVDITQMLPGKKLN